MIVFVSFSCLFCGKLIWLLGGSFYIHSSIFTDVSKSTWRIGSSPNIESTLHPLLQLFRHLTIKPYQKAPTTLSCSNTFFGLCFSFCISSSRLSLLLRNLTLANAPSTWRYVFLFSFFVHLVGNLET